jgi:hypothetical protein
MSKVNKLSSGTILSAYSKEFNQKKITLSIGKTNYEVLVDEKFKPSKLQKMIVEALTNFNALKEYDEGVKLSYYMFLLIKHFTDIDIAQTDNLEEQIRILNAMVDLEIYEPLVNSFDKAEIQKATEYMKKFSERIAELAKDNNINDIKSIVESEIKDEVTE